MPKNLIKITYQYPAKTHGDSLRDYIEARNFALKAGLLSDTRFTCRVFGPTHPGHKKGTVITEDRLKEPKWVSRVIIQIDDGNAMAKASLNRVSWPAELKKVP